MEGVKSRTRVTAKQINLLIEYMEGHSEFAHGKLSASFSKADRKKSWEEIAEILNCEGPGAIKTPEQWRKTWNDQKSNARAKLATLRKNQNKTGGGPQTEEFLSTVEERILNLIGWISATGNEEIPEGGISSQTTLYASDTEVNAGIATAPTETDPIDMPSGSGEQFRMPIKNKGRKRRKVSNAFDAAGSLMGIIEIQNEVLSIIAEATQQHAAEASLQTVMMGELIQELKNLTKSVQDCVKSHL